MRELDMIYTNFIFPEKNYMLYQLLTPYPEIQEKEKKIVY